MIFGKSAYKQGQMLSDCLASLTMVSLQEIELAEKRKADYLTRKSQY